MLTKNLSAMSRNKTFEKLNLLTVDESSSMPKYMQIVNLIISDIENGIFKEGELIPSINETSSDFYISRDTVEKAYRILKEMGVICSVRGKGYFVAQRQGKCEKKVLIISNEFSEDVRMVSQVLNHFDCTGTGIQIHFHVGNPELLKNTISSYFGIYDYYVVLSDISRHDEKMKEAIEVIPPGKVVFIQKYNSCNNNGFAYFVFNRDRVLSWLESNKCKFKSYDHIWMCSPESTFFSEMYNLFVDFFLDNQLSFSVYTDARNLSVKSGSIYIAGNEEELSTILKLTGESQDLKIGKEISLISLKKTVIGDIFAGGITSLGVDYQQICRGLLSVANEGIKGRINLDYQLFHGQSF